MRRFTAKLSGCLTAIFSFLVSGACVGQTIEECLRFAHQQFALQHYNETIELYERVAFFGKDQLQVAEYLELADSYRQVKDFEKAAVNYETAANLVAENDSLRTGFFLKVTLCQLMQSQYQESLVTLYNLADSLSPNLQKTKLLYTGLTNFKLNQFEEADSAFIQYFRPTPDLVPVQKLLKRNRRLDKRYNPKKVKVMSILVPGLGQIYCGDVRNGLNSFLLNGALIALSINYMASYSFLDGFMSVGPWFQRYYVGGFTRAKKGAEDKIEKERLKIMNTILSKAESY